jgi:hypothetical protein
MENVDNKTTKWYHYFCAFFAGLFLTDGIKNLVNGPQYFLDMTRQIPYPWLDILTLILGALCFWLAKMSLKKKLLILVFACGIAVNLLLFN